MLANTSLHAAAMSPAGASTLSANPFTDAVSAAAHALAGLSTALAPIGGAAVAVIVITLLVRLVLHPLTRAAVRGERARVRLTPHINALRRKHGTDPTRFRQELAALHRAEGVSPIAGVGPMLLQLPVFLVLYRVYTHHMTGLAGGNLFGTPLTSRLLTAWTGPHVFVFLLLFAALAAVAVVTSRRAAMLAKINNQTADVGTASSPQSPISPTMIATIGRIAPFFVLLSAAVVPLAAGLYLVTTTAWTAAENAFLRRGLPVSLETVPQQIRQPSTSM
jgi:YidC/Oxa1 family membrane protein insertase